MEITKVDNEFDQWEVSSVSGDGKHVFAIIEWFNRSLGCVLTVNARSLFYTRGLREILDFMEDVERGE